MFYPHHHQPVSQSFRCCADSLFRLSSHRTWLSRSLSFSFSHPRLLSHAIIVLDETAHLHVCFWGLFRGGCYCSVVDDATCRHYLLCSNGGGRDVRFVAPDSFHVRYRKKKNIYNWTYQPPVLLLSFCAGLNWAFKSGFVVCALSCVWCFQAIV